MTVEQMKKANWLNRAYFINNKINALIVEREQSYDLATKITPSYENDGSTNSLTDVNSMEVKIQRILDIDRKIDSEIDSYVDIKKEISNAIDNIKSDNDDLDAVLRLHFLAFKTWEDVAEILNISRMTVHRKYIKALDKMILNVTL